MLCGVYGDVHLTKNMRSLQSVWEVTATKSIYYMYDKFDELDVEMAVCLGDFFDAPRLEAKHMNFVLPILDNINSRSYPTYILLGNHEADSSDSNILDFLATYDNIIPVTKTTDIEGMLFIPYYDDPQLYDINSNHIVFTHHDIYGSDLASGQTKAFFGLPPVVFKDAKLVMNGHVHLKSRVSDNIINAGSILTSCQGELRIGEYPSYYLLDTKDASLEYFDNEYSMIYLAIDESQAGEVTKYENLVLRVDYEDKIPETFINTLHTSWRKKLLTIGESESTQVRLTSNFDMKNYVTEYIKRDTDISDEDRDEYIKVGMELLS